MITTIGRAALLVRNEDEAKAFYADAFGFVTLHDERLDDGFRAVHVGPPGQDGVGLWLIRSAEGVGAQAGGHPLFVFYTDDLDAQLRRLDALGVSPSRGPIHEPNRGERYAHVRDLYGNEIALVQLES